MDLKELMKSTAEAMDIAIEDKELNQFMKYKELLTQWNKVMNLTAIKDEREIIIKHFIDSISPVNYLREKNIINALDLGTGAGFPGVPLKIMMPAVPFTLMDSVNKKLKFIGEVVDALNLEGVQLVHARAEDGGKSPEFREKYDVCLSRAVAGLDVLCEYCLPFVRKGGFLIAYKGPGAEEEIKTSARALKILGGTVEEVKNIHIPGSDYNHNLLFIAKNGHTPPQYPRKPGIVREDPIK